MKICEQSRGECIRQRSWGLRVSEKAGEGHRCMLVVVLGLVFIGVRRLMREVAGANAACIQDGMHSHVAVRCR